MSAKKSQHISSILASFRWLPVGFRIKYKALYVLQVLHGMALAYVSELITFRQSFLRSSNKLFLTVPRTV